MSAGEPERISGSELIARKLREYGDLTRAALAPYLPALEPRQYLYDLVADYPS